MSSCFHASHVLHWNSLSAWYDCSGDDPTPVIKDSFLSHFEKPAGGSTGGEEDDGGEDVELIADHESATVSAITYWCRRTGQSGSDLGKFISESGWLCSSFSVARRRI